MTIGGSVLGGDGGDPGLLFEDLSEAQAEREAIAALDPAPRSRARRAAPDDMVPSVFGPVPVGVTYWGISKRNELGANVSQGWAPPGAGVESREWPLSELSEATIRSRWGAGHFSPHWIRVSPNGGRRVLRCARVIHVLPLAVDSPPAAVPSMLAAPSSPLGEAFALARELRQMAKDEGDSSIDRIIAVAQLMGGRQNQGLGAAELELILSRALAASSAATAAAISAAVEPLKRQIAELSEDDATPIADAARAAVPFLKGKGAGVSALNFLAANPDLAKTGLELAQSALSTVEKVIARAPDPVPAVASVAAIARPRALAVVPSSPLVGEPAEVIEAWQSLPEDRSTQLV